jgi:hypothetical protein
MARARELAVGSTLAHLSPAVSFEDRNHLVDLLRHVVVSDRPTESGTWQKQVGAPARRIDRR